MSADHYDELSEGEQAHWDEYTRLRELSDWPGYSDAQRARKEAARAWLDERRAELWHDLTDEPVNDAENEANDRRERYEQLAPDKLNGGGCRHLCQLPTGHATESESALISEREMWWRVESTTDAQHARKVECTDALTAKRKELWHLIEDDPENNAQNHRDERYDNLSVATKYGSAYDAWLETHNATTGDELSGDWRELVRDWHESHIGITESPAGSNCDTRSDGIRTSQDGCANGTWLRNQPWCGCWTWSGLHAAGKVDKGASWLASVASIEDYARNGQGPFRGWTTDGTKADTGDLVVLFGRGQHVGTVRERPTSDTLKTWEGNTSGEGQSGSQSNGGGSYKRSRSRSNEVYGYALVKD
jgi:hypothetical protein